MDGKLLLLRSLRIIYKVLRLFTGELKTFIDELESEVKQISDLTIK